MFVALLVTSIFALSSGAAEVNINSTMSFIFSFGHIFFSIAPILFNSFTATRGHQKGAPAVLPAMPEHHPGRPLQLRGVRGL